MGRKKGFQDFDGSSIYLNVESTVFVYPKNENLKSFIFL